MKWFALFGIILCLGGCGSGSSSNTSQTSQQPQPTVTSVTVTPSTASVVAGQTQQFSSTVTGTGSFNQAVTWSVVGAGTVNQSGLFTANQTPGPATVSAVSQANASMSGEAQITVAAAPVAMRGWYGTLVPSDGSAPLPLDFDLTETGSTLTSGPVLIIAATANDISYCKNFDLFMTQGSGSVLAGQPNNPLPAMSGTVNGQNVTLSYTPYYFGSQPTITMTGTLTTDASGYGVITGTYATPLSACVSGNSGTFTFNQYQTFLGTYIGSFTDGTVGSGSPPVTANNVQITLTAGTPVPGQNGANGGALSYSAIPPPFNYPASPVYTMLTETAGRFFHAYTSYVGAEQGSTTLVVWGVVAGPDQQGNQLNGYVGTGSVGMTQLFAPSTPLSGTLTKQ